MSGSGSDDEDDLSTNDVATASATQKLTRESIGVYTGYLKRVKEHQADLLKVEKYMFLEDGGGTYLYEATQGRQISTCSKKGGW
jgi:hypothetical protein